MDREDTKARSGRTIENSGFHRDRQRFTGILKKLPKSLPLRTRGKESAPGPPGLPASRSRPVDCSSITSIVGIGRLPTHITARLRSLFRRAQDRSDHRDVVPVGDTTPLRAAAAGVRGCLRPRAGLSRRSAVPGLIRSFSQRVSQGGISFERPHRWHSHLQ